MDESGQDLVKYALIVAVGSLTGAMGNLYQSMTGRLTGVEWQEAAK